MTTDQRAHKRPRRVPKSVRCLREGCTRRKGGGLSHCSELCSIVADEITQTEELCRTAGPGPLSTDLWLAATELGDALSAYRRLTVRLRGLVRDQGQYPRTDAGVA
jgi:hypothetical protein